ncbi:HAMP domain-containing protein [Anaerobacillus sp. HL2]|nr:HAMP domain-containing protein [Anaerobacillus sp. HL2]
MTSSWNILSFYLANLIVKPIKAVVSRIEIIAKGDLTGEELKTKSKDEIGTLTNSVNTMVQS